MEKKIKSIIRQVGDIGEKLSKLIEEESPPRIETDIILSDIRVLYEAVKDLQDSPHTIASVEVEKKPDTNAKPTPEEAVVATEPEIVVPEKPVKTESPVKNSEPATLGDKFKGEQKFINESLADKKQDLGSKIHSTPISNIGSALGVNDRFKLINDLFNGDKDSFQKTIGILDGAPNFNEAFSYISSSFDWDMEGDSVQLLLELVRRKFIVNQNE
ncbi:hypothetical protein ACFLTA_02695 [Bacteroidota bacterium]